ncbi:MAG: nuclear transport factor 2 family protein [Filimonas sp.]|nr:nuclear transport factor 2 family protein [Filimonas sp.]
METKQIAERLAELCRAGQFEAAQKELFANDAVSLEPFATPDFEQETKGLDAIIEKGHKFESMVKEMNDITVSEPLVAGNSFTFLMTMDLVMKKDDKRYKMGELCVYEVKDGKVISERFFM